MSKKSYQIRVDEVLFNKFRVVAEKNHRSIIGHIAFLMEQTVQNYEAEHGEIDANQEFED